jgi:hypothetical protein
LLLNPFHFRYLNELHDQGNCLVVLLIVTSCCLVEWTRDGGAACSFFLNTRIGVAAEKRRQQRPDLLTHE